MWFDFRADETTTGMCYGAFECFGSVKRSRDTKSRAVRTDVSRYGVPGFAGYTEKSPS
jgi:hypothetical protein